MLLTLEEQERSKYERMWDIPQYRENSPGERGARQALHELKADVGEMFDFGCGTGRASKIFAEHGLLTTGIDIASNAPEDPETWTFITANLWDLPEGFFKFPADWGYCVDVMEHIPTEKVESVFDNISKAVKGKCYFSACLGHDGFGRKIGETLHLTVETPDWWFEKARPHFKELINPRHEPGHAVFIGSNA